MHEHHLSASRSQLKSLFIDQIWQRHMIRLYDEVPAIVEFIRSWGASLSNWVLFFAVLRVQVYWGFKHPPWCGTRQLHCLFIWSECISKEFASAEILIVFSSLDPLLVHTQWEDRFGTSCRVPKHRLCIKNCFISRMLSMHDILYAWDRVLSIGLSCSYRRCTC